MGALFRGLMVPISFLLFLAFFGAIAVAVIAGGPISQGLAPDQLPTLLKPEGAPSPFLVAAGVALLVDLFVAIVAMFIAEHVFSARRFAAGCLKTAFWFALFAAAGLAFWLFQSGASGLAGYLPAILLFVGSLVAGYVTGLLLGKPFVWWVSERPPQPRRRRAPAPTPPPPAEEAAPVVVADSPPPPQEPVVVAPVQSDLAPQAPVAPPARV